MDLQRLEEFTLLVKSGSFTKAAAQLQISVSLLSNHMSVLEEKLGVRLMERNAHRVELTDAGKRFYSDALDLCSEYQQLLSGIVSHPEEDERSIRIAMTGQILPGRLGPYLDIVNLKYPNVHINIYDDSRFGIEEGLNSGLTDLYFSHARSDLHFPGIEREQIYLTKVQVIVPLNHHLANRGVISVKELDGERFVLYPETAEPAMRESERELLDNAGISYTLYEDHVCPSSYYIMVPVGKGIVLCPWSSHHMIPPNSTVLSVTEPDFEASMYMYYRKDNPNPFVHEFVEGFRTFDFGGAQ